MGSAPPFGFRRLTQESTVASTVALFQRKTAQNAVELDMSACSLLAQLLQRAEASALLPNFVDAEFNDNDGAWMIMTAAACEDDVIDVLRCASVEFWLRLCDVFVFMRDFICSETFARAPVDLAWPKSSASSSICGCCSSLMNIRGPTFAIIFSLH